MSLMEKRRAGRTARTLLVLAAILAAASPSCGRRSSAGFGVWLEGATIATISDKIYAFGGYANGKLTNAVFEYDPSADRWVRKRPMPSPRAGATATALDKAVYVAGGRGAAGPIDFVDRYDPVRDVWKRVKPLPFARQGHAAAVVGGRLHVFGGAAVKADGEAPVADYDIYDPDTDTWAAGPPVPIACSGIMAAALGEKIYVIGAGPPPVATLIYDDDRRSWAVGAPLPAEKWASAAAYAAEGKIYLNTATESGQGERMVRVFVYAPTGNVWSEWASAKVRYAPLLGASEGKAFAAEPRGQTRVVEPWTRPTLLTTTAIPVVDSVPFQPEAGTGPDPSTLAARAAGVCTAALPAGSLGPPMRSSIEDKSLLYVERENGDGGGEWRYLAGRPLAARTAANVRSVVCISERRVRSSSNPGGEPEVRTYWDVRLVDWRTAKPRASATLTGDLPRKLRAWIVAAAIRTADVVLPGIECATLQLSENGRLLKCADALWDLPSGRRLAALKDTTRVELSPNGRLAATVGADGAVTLRAAATGRVLHRLPVKGGDVAAMAFNRTSSIVAVAVKSGQIGLWDTGTGSLTRSMNSSAQCVAFARDGRLMVTGGDDGILRFWNLETGAEIRKMPGNGAAIGHVAFSPDGRVVAAATADHLVRVWELSSESALRTLVHIGDASGLRFDPTGDYLVATDLEGSKVWEWRYSTCALLPAGYLEPNWKAVLTPTEFGLARSSILMSVAVRKLTD